ERFATSEVGGVRRIVARVGALPRQSPTDARALPRAHGRRSPRRRALSQRFDEQAFETIAALVLLDEDARRTHAPRERVELGGIEGVQVLANEQRDRLHRRRSGELDELDRFELDPHTRSGASTNGKHRASTPDGEDERRWPWNESRSIRHESAIGG